MAMRSPLFGRFRLRIKHFLLNFILIRLGEGKVRICSSNYKRRAPDWNPTSKQFSAPNALLLATKTETHQFLRRASTAGDLERGTSWPLMSSS